MKVYVKMLQGTECLVEIDGSTKGSDLKEKVEQDLKVSRSTQCLVYKGKTISDDSDLSSFGLSEGCRIHLMVKKDSKASSTKQTELFMQLEILLRKHLTVEETAKVVKEFKSNCQLMVDSMNFDDIERFAASNFTEF